MYLGMNYNTSTMFVVCLSMKFAYLPVLCTHLDTAVGISLAQLDTSFPFNVNMGIARLTILQCATMTTPPMGTMHMHVYDRPLGEFS